MEAPQTALIKQLYQKISNLGNKLKSYLILVFKKLTKFRRFELINKERCNLDLYLFQDRRYELGLTYDGYERSLFAISFIFIHLEFEFDTRLKKGIKDSGLPLDSYRMHKLD